MKHIFFTTAIFLLAIAAKAQLKLADEKAADKLTPKEFSIPVSPLFDLLGAAPSQVVHGADIKDFKVDWSFKNWKVNPNLAIQGQPLWELLYNRKKLDKYQNASAFMRCMASIDVSAGSVQGEGSERKLGGAVKINLYKQKDPLLIKNVYDDIQKTFEEELAQLKDTEKKLLKQLESAYKPTETTELRKELQKNDEQLVSFYKRRNEAIQEKAASFLKDNWNKAFIDFAAGRIYTYNTDTAGTFKKLQLNRNTGSGMWVNFGFGIGKRWLVAGLVRNTFYEEEVTFSIKDDVTGDETSQTAVAKNNLLTAGINFRYGGPVYNFFAEVVIETKTIKTPDAALLKAFNTPAGKSVISNTVKWDAVNPYIINIGGDWRFSRNVILNYGFRCVFDQHFKNTSFTPIANISCMMR